MNSKKCFLLALALVMGVGAFAEQPSWDFFKKQKKDSHHAIGVSLMGKTFKSNGVTMSYFATEQGTMTFGAGVDFNYEKMIHKTPLGILTGFRCEYTKPYGEIEDEYGSLHKVSANDLMISLPLMLQYHDKLGSSTELLLFAGPSVEFVAYRQTQGGDAFIFGSNFGTGSPRVWNWVGLSLQYGIGLAYNDLTFKISTSYGVLNHFKKDVTAQYLGYPVYINRPIVASVLFNI